MLVVAPDEGTDTIVDVVEVVAATSGPGADFVAGSEPCAHPATSPVKSATARSRRPPDATDHRNALSHIVHQGIPRALKVWASGASVLNDEVVRQRRPPILMILIHVWLAAAVVVSVVRGNWGAAAAGCMVLLVGGSMAAASYYGSTGGRKY